ncbi:MAG: hypothetical protein COA97_01330 [Flavobacteriales bacterium]|nr:MAG: hypothetical protein COA97_01330 [Flavobacteriales bacterium]
MIKKDYRDEILTLLISSKKAWSTSELAKKYKKTNNQINILIEFMLDENINGYPIIDNNKFDGDNYTIKANRYSEQYKFQGGFTISALEAKIDKHKSEKRQEKEDIKLENELKLSNWQVKYYWLFFIIAVVGGLCGVISLVVSISKGE